MVIIIALDLHRMTTSNVMRKQAFCICEKKDPDQLRDNREEAGQRLCFCYTDSKIPLLPTAKI